MKKLRTQSLVRRLALDGEPEGGWTDAEIESIEQALDAADPLAHVTLRAQCDQCGHAWQAPLDIGASLWDELAAQARFRSDADAAKKHPYELTLAHEYYVKAKEEAGYSQFEISEKLAKQASEYAHVAAGEATATPTPDEDEVEEKNKELVP